MGVFSGGGFGAGILARQDHQAKRRSEIAKMFQEYKNQNPYATAEDYNSFIESVVGPNEYYLRGSVPAQNILERMAADNEKQKKYDEQKKFVESAAANVELGNTIRKQAEESILQYGDRHEFVNAMTSSFAGQNATPEQRQAAQQWVEENVGQNYDNMRSRAEADLIQDGLKRFREFMNQFPEAENAEEIWKMTVGSMGLEGTLGKFDPKFVEAFKNRAKSEFDDLERKRRNEFDDRFYDAYNDIITNPSFRDKAIPGDASMEALEADIDNHLRYKYRSLWESNKPEHKERLAQIKRDAIKSLIASKTINDDAATEKKRSAAAPLMTESMAKQQDVVNTLLAGRVGAEVKNPVAQSAVQSAMTMYDIPQQLHDSLIAFANQFDESEGNATELAAQWYNSLGEIGQQMVPLVADRSERVTKAINARYPERERAEDYIKASREKITSNFDKFDLSLKKMGEKLEGAKGNLSALKAMLSRLDNAAIVVDRSMKAWKKQSDRDIANPRDWLEGGTPIDQDSFFRGAWSTAEARQRATLETMSTLRLAIQEEIKRAEAAINSTVGSGNVPAAAPTPPSSVPPSGSGFINP